MSKPDQMFDHVLDAIKGWPSPYAVDKHADLANGEVVIRGMVMSMNASQQFEAGLFCGAMPVFALQNSTDFDVVGDDGNLVGSTGLARMSGLVAVGGYEVETTEYDATAAYAPNDCLTSPEPGEANAGRLEKGVAYTDTICGVVSNGALTNENRISVLRLWPVWLPPLSCGSSSQEG
jgi:hypothetical protein